MARGGEPRLVLRFTVASLVAFVLVGAVGMFLMVRLAREREERQGVFHSTFVANAVLMPLLDGADLSRPLAGPAYERVLRHVRERVLSNDRDVRVKVWSADGTVVFSDVRALVGERFPDEVEELAEVFDGHARAGVSALDAKENAAERPLADQLLEVYVPLRATPDGRVIAVAELYQDYAVIQADIDAFVARMAPVLAVGLVVLYAAILPIAFRASQDLRRSNERLAELLAREQETVAELRELSQKKSDFVAAASHELRTPLTAIIGNLTTLRQPDLASDGEVRSELLEAAGQQADRLLRLITNLLHAAHVEEGTRPVRTSSFSLDELLDSIVFDLPRGAERVVRTVPPDLPEITSDRDRVREILTNLIDNALKYSADGAPVTVGAEPADGDLVMWVRDEGLGIAPEERVRIFDRFYQVDQSSTRRFGGVGLGLFLVKELTLDLGGSVTVDSREGMGSTFRVELPSALRCPSDHRASPDPVSA